MKLNHFASIADAVNYLRAVLNDSLQNELDCMEHEPELHTDEDRTKMRVRIADLESVMDLMERIFTPSKSESAPKQPMPKRHAGEMGYIVEYELPYTHCVQVGVYADSVEAAEEKAEQAFNEARIWDDTPEMPLLYDDFEEAGDAGVALKFNVVGKCKEFPEPDASVITIRRNNAARTTLAALQKRDLLKALQIADSYPE